VPGNSVLDSTVPVLSVDHLEKALRYYESVLGFQVAWTWGDPPHLAGVCRDRVELNLGERGKAGPTAASQVYFRMRGVDAYFEQISKAGAETRTPPGDRPYGMRDFSIRDPSGNVLDFGEAKAANG